MKDVFQPRSEPARSIYEAFQTEAGKRDGRGVNDWLPAETNAVHREAVIQAQKLGLHAPSIDEVARAERYASGSVDYGATWAYKVVDTMRAGA